MSISRRDLLAKFSLALPTAAVLAVASHAEAETTASETHHHKRKHHARTASHKHGHPRTAQSRPITRG